MKVEKLIINGQRRPMPPNDELPKGKGAFESFRVHKKSVFLLDEHFDRLDKSLKAMDIAWDNDRKKYRRWIHELCADLPTDKDAFVRLSVIQSASGADVILQAGYIPPFQPKDYEAVILEDSALKAPDYFERIGFRIKSINYISERLKERKATSLNENQEGILLTQEGYVAEALSANIFWVKDEKLFTPPLSTGILAGTIRAYLIKNYEITESLAPSKILEEANEIILTSGASYLRPLSKINSTQKPGVAGSIYRRIYAQLVKDIKKYSQPL